MSPRPSYCMCVFSCSLINRPEKSDAFLTVNSFNCGGVVTSLHTPPTFSRHVTFSFSLFSYSRVFSPLAIFLRGDKQNFALFLGTCTRTVGIKRVRFVGEVRPPLTVMRMPTTYYEVQRFKLYAGQWFVVFQVWFLRTTLDEQDVDRRRMRCGPP